MNKNKKLVYNKIFLTRKRFYLLNDIVKTFTFFFYRNQSHPVTV